MSRALRRLAVVVVTAGALLASPVTAPASFASSPPVERVGYNSLLGPGTGLELNLWVIGFIHGLAGVVPGTTGGRLSAITINVGALYLPDGGEVDVGVYDRAPLTSDPLSGGPDALLSSATIPGDQLPTSPGYLRVPLQNRVSVRPGEQLVVTLRMFTPTGNGALVVYGAAAPTTMLYGFHSGVFQPMGNAQLQIATSFVGR